MAVITVPLNTTNPDGLFLDTRALEAYIDVTMTAGTGGKYSTIAVQVKGVSTAANVFNDILYTTGSFKMNCAMPPYGKFRYRIVNQVSGCSVDVQATAPSV